MDQTQNGFRAIPAIDRLLTAALADRELCSLPRSFLRAAAQAAAEECRREIAAGKQAPVTVPALLARIRELAAAASLPGPRRVVNATGVILHTNLGRAPLSRRACHAVTAAMGYCDLEFDLASGERGHRSSHVAARLCALTGAEDALAVNNNAAAVLLVLAALAAGREVVVSRGQLVEIGGSFRIPDVLRQSGATLVEVGTTNKTSIDDYARAIGENTAAILKVHTSNYRIIGFTAQPTDAELTALAKAKGIPLLEDLGSGTLLPVTAGDWREPPVGERIAAGIDVVMFSGDKLLGGSQAGIIVGRRNWLAPLKHHPLLRAVRLDKLTLAALAGTLADYQVGDPARDVPVQAMLRQSEAALESRAGDLLAALAPLRDQGWSVEMVKIFAQAGGGALPAVNLASCGVAVTAPGLSSDRLVAALRRADVPVVARVQEDKVVFDVRCLQDGDITAISRACTWVAAGP